MNSYRVKLEKNGQIKELVLFDDELDQVTRLQAHGWEVRVCEQIGTGFPVS